MTRIIVLTLGFLFLTTSTLFSQKKYEKEWLAIEALEVDGKVKSALEKVNTLSKKVKSQKNNIQYIKTLLFRWKFTQVIDEKSQVTILEELESEIKKQEFPTKQLLHMYMAHFLETYLNDNYWTISQRTTTEKAEVRNYQTWDQNTFINQISSHYERALTPYLNLASIPTKDVAELLVTVPISRKYKPTLYDIIVHKALDFYKNSRNRINKPKDEFLINTDSYFESSANFIKQKISTPDTESLIFKGIKAYQQLETIHSQRKNEIAWVTNVLERLQFVKSHHIGSNTENLYLQSLQKTVELFKDKNAIAKIELEMARAYRTLSFQKDEKGMFKFPDYNKKAIELLNNIEEQKIDVATIIETKNLKAQILQKKITWLTQDKYLPNKPHLAKVTFTNTQEITLNAFKIPFDFDQNQWNYAKRDSLLKDYISKRKKVFTKKYTLPKKTDHNTYSTEVIVPELLLGTYLFQIQTEDLKESFKYHKVQVTQLTLNKTGKNNSTLYQILNRYSGIPISNAKVIVEKSKDRRNRDTYSKKEYRTNGLGEFTIPKSNRYENHTITVQSLNDTIRISEYNYGRYNNYNYFKELNKRRSKILVFLDRGIYRPKQTVYFKAIAISEENQKSTVVSDTPIEITVSNPNGEKVFSTTLTSNEYGSVHGEFKLPEGGLNGNYSINVRLKKQLSKNDQSGYQSFSVEEYKRPTFEVSFLPASKVYKPLDSVTVKGNAKAFLGSMITEATVEYSVKRTVEYRNYWWSRPRNNEAKQIATGEIITNDKGEFKITFKAETDEADTKDKIYNYKVEAKVTDLNGETRENTTNIKVADKNLIATINTTENWNASENSETQITITDVNGNPIKANGKVTIYKLQSPGRFLNNRPWPTPDIQNITEKEFKKLFPHIPFSNEKDPKNWKRGKLYCEHEFKNTDKVEINCEDIKKWPAGKFIIISSVTDPITKATTETQKSITLNHPKQEVPTDEQVFISKVDYNIQNPTKAKITLQTATPKLIVFAEYFDGHQSFKKEKIILEKGIKDYTLSIPNLTFPTVTANFKYQIYHKFYTKTETLDFSKKPIQLAIEKKHFTDKLVPGGKETWSFLLKTSNKSSFNAEALASMYDASLDQFRSNSWSSNFGFSKSYPKPNQPQGLFGLSTQSINYTNKTVNLPTKKYPWEKLNHFGFEFDQVNSWKSRQYLSRLRAKNKKLVPSKGYTTILGIVSGSGLPLPGVSVSIIGNTGAAVTDFDGEFSIDAKLGDKLKIHSLGYKEIIHTIKKKDFILNIELEENPNALEEIVVIGYDGIKEKKSAKMTFSESEASSKIMIRGNSSLPSTNKPLYVVDGVLVENIEGMDPSSIGNIEVLKDVSSTAIYGSRGANGVIIVNSKSGKQRNNSKVDDLKTIQTRKNLQETAFFLPNLRTNKKGEIEFEFESPEALTRWNFRMLAHTKEAIAGSLNLQTLTQKDLNIIPNAPRFVREGDQLRFTAKVANLTSEKMNGTALLEWTDPTTGNTVNQELKHKQLTQNFSIDANGNSLLSWTISIPENLSAIQYKIVAKANNFTDGEEKAIPVLSNRMLVTESIPLWVRAGETESFELTNFEPNSTTQKPHQITLEYTSNPAWVAIKSLPYLMEFPHECSEQTFSRLYANAISTHILNSQPKIKSVFESWAKNKTLQSPLEKNEELKNILLTESPWLREAKSETEQQKRLATLFDLAKMAKAQQKAINKLRQLQKSNGGFPWFQGGRANSYITRHVVTGFGHLEKLGVTEQRTKTDNIVKNAIRFLDNELIEDYNEYLKHHKTAEGFYKQVRLLHYLYARSFYKERFPLKGKVKDIMTKALTFQETNWRERSIYEKGILALILHRFKKSPVTQKIVTALTESAVNSKANGMYWKENTSSWWWYRNPIVTQALLIEAFAETEQPKKYIEEMKIFLLKNKRTNRWESTIETANASYALLLNGNDWLSIKDNTVINVGDTKISTKKLSETEKERGTGYLKTTWKANEITPDFKTVTVKNNSKVVGYGGYYWQYFENLDNIKTDEKGPLAIDKELYKKTTTDKGTELKRITTTTPLEIGDKVTVRLLIKSDDNLEFVHLKDMRASGFEPTKVLSGYEYKELWYYQSTKDVATHFFIDRLPKGNYVLEYDVIANQAGSFSNGITTLQCMYAPEFSSHSAGQRVEIKE